MKIIICLIMFGGALGIYCTYDRFYRDFLILQDEANRLLQQECVNCIVEANVRYIGREKPDAFLKYKGHWEHRYNYSYQVNNQSYYQDVLINSGLAKYFASPSFSYKKGFPEKVIIDANNPAVSLPLKYAKMLVNGKEINKFTYERYSSLLIIIIALGTFFYQLITPSKDKGK